MIKNGSLILTLILIQSCSLTYSPTKRLDDNKFKITTFGTALNTEEELRKAMYEKAYRKCGSHKFTFEYEDITTTEDDGNYILIKGVGLLNKITGNVTAIVNCKN